MLRKIVTLSVIALAALTWGAIEADASGAGGRANVAPMRAVGAPPLSGQRPMFGQRQFSEQRHILGLRPDRVYRGHRFARRYGRHFPDAGLPFPGSLSFPGAFLIEKVAEPTKPVDRNSFENFPIRVGIARPPAPEPVIYRIEGPRERPVARVIRIVEAEATTGRRTRYAHAETGALLLTAPRR